MTSRHITPRRCLDVEELYPIRVAAFELGGRAGADDLHTAEAAQVQTTSPVRQGDFAAGRACAHQAMAELGHDRSPVLIGKSREPVWPSGLTGSITHTADLAIAVMSETTSPPHGIGVDAEAVGRVDAEIESIVLSETEQKALDNLSPIERAAAATAIFGAKEALYKAQWPLTSSWVGFHDVTASLEGSEIVLEPSSDLGALSLISWPIRAQLIERSGIVIVGCVAYGV